jgi:hypothetical protein
MERYKHLLSSYGGGNTICFRGLIATGLDQEGASTMRHRFAVSFLLAITSALVAGAAEKQPPLAGQWEGAVQIPGYELRVVIDLAPQDQQWVGSLTAPQFGVKGTPLTGIAVKQNDVEFGTRWGAAFKAHLESDGTLKGEFKQGGNSAPLLLKRVGEAHVDFPELSTPMSKEIQGEWKGTIELPSTKINVVLKLPNGGTPSAPAGELLIDAGNQKIPITLWKQEGAHVFAAFGEGGLSYDGEFHKEAAEIVGSIRSGSVELPVTLHRGTTDSSTPATANAHPETK